MLKRKKRRSAKRSTRRKPVKKKLETPHEPNLLVRQAGAITMLIVAVFLLLGGFGTGGSMPIGMFDLVYKVF